MSKSIKILALTLLLAGVAAAQTIPEKKVAEDRENLEREAVAFLRETLSDVNSMRSLENRISFTAEIAGLMWFHDEREARAMYGGVINDFKDLLTRYDAQINSLGITAEEGMSRSSPMSFMLEPTDKSRLLRRMDIAMGVRQQIAMSIAEHDPDLAFAFYSDSLLAISNPEFRKRGENNDAYFETQLLGQIAESNAAKASQYAAKMLTKSVAYQHVELLKKIYAKDPEKGADYAVAILSRLKSDKLESSGFYVVESLMRFGGETLDASKKPGGKKPVYTTAELRELAELFAQALLNRPDNESISQSYIDVIQKYAPGRAIQLKAKFKSASSEYKRASNVMYTAGNSNANANSAYYGDPRSNSNSNAESAFERELREKQDAERRLMEEVNGLSTKQLPKEERDKIVAQARKIITQTPGREKKVAALGMLAAQIAKMGDKELAGEIMRDAEALVNPAPKNYQDFMLSWMLASGYAATDPDKAFPLLEETIGRANDTLAAFIKVGEFIDVAEEMIQDGEVQVGAFGGQMVRGLTRELGIADSTIQVLAKADFGKTKNLTNRFDRTEIRVLAKMMILRAVLNPKKASKPEDIDGLMAEPADGN
ncbi:MAG: hypothetical protein ABI646_03150 [Acidobacteriota bacterium]